MWAPGARSPCVPCALRLYAAPVSGPVGAGSTLSVCALRPAALCGSSQRTMWAPGARSPCVPCGLRLYAAPVSGPCGRREHALRVCPAALCGSSQRTSGRREHALRVCPAACGYMRLQSADHVGAGSTLSVCARLTVSSGPAMMRPSGVCSAVRMVSGPAVHWMVVGAGLEVKLMVRSLSSPSVKPYRVPTSDPSARYGATAERGRQREPGQLFHPGTPDAWGKVKHSYYIDWEWSCQLANCTLSIEPRKYHTKDMFNKDMFVVPFANRTSHFHVGAPARIMPC